MSKIQNVDALEFDSIKNNIKEFLRGKPEFTDYDYEGSAMSILIDVLAYNTHYSALHTNMALNESFIDSASKYSSVVSLAKSLGYTSKSAKSATAKLTVVVTDVPDSPEVLTLPKHTSFKSIKDNKQLLFCTLNVYTAKRIADRYTFEIDVTEGYPISNFYIVADGVDFVIPNGKIDLKTLNVFIQESKTSSSIKQFYRVDEILSVGPNDDVFYIKQREDIFYQVFFGDDVIGSSVQPGNVVYLEYLVSNGSIGNGCSAFFYSSGARGDALYSVTTTQKASGAADAEDINSIKFNAPRNYIAQNRAVTTDDYKNQILSNFPQVQSISVWGGQDNVPPQYGRVFISAKPYGRAALNELEKREIDQFLTKKRSVLTVQQRFVDPTIIQIGIDVNVYYNPLTTTKSTGVLQTMVQRSIQSYADDLNVFDATFRFSRLSGLIDSSDPSIVSNISNIYLMRSVNPSLGIFERYTVEMGNPLSTKAGSIQSTRINMSGYDSPVSIQNTENGGLYLVEYSAEGTKNMTQTKVGTVDYDKGTFVIDNIRVNSLVEPVWEFKLQTMSNDIIPIRQNILSIPDSLVTINVISDSTASGFNKDFIFSASR